MAVPAGGCAGEMYAAKLTSFHIASLDNNPFTVYVVTVRKQNAQWRVFRRYKEWEDLRARLHQWCGGSPNMPGKMLFGRMRPEVIEARVLGLNHFLQQALTSPQFACPDLIDFLEREKNMPPPGLDLGIDPHEPADASTPDGTAELARQAQLKQLVDATAAAFIPVSHEPPILDASYLAERAATYEATLRPTDGPLAGAVISLEPPPATPPSSAAVEVRALGSQLPTYTLRHRACSAKPLTLSPRSMALFSGCAAAAARPSTVVS